MVCFSTVLSLNLRHRDVFARVLAGSLPKVSQQDVRILRVSDGHQHGSRQGAKERRALRSGGRRMQRSGVQIDFEVLPSGNATSDAMEHVEAWLLLLREAGQASHRFDVSLEKALEEEGVTLSLSDGEMLHVEFGTPRHPLAEVESNISGSFNSPSARSSSQQDDGGDIFLAVFLGIGVLVGGMFLVVSMIVNTASSY
mmetsp:Transcript_14561/g.23268  ORF Transcript_14561/g.23268 Transcript_14561/m.23268 type:complete len:198 (+) Transcript_14561:190-783(+)